MARLILLILQTGFYVSWDQIFIDEMRHWYSNQTRNLLLVCPPLKNVIMMLTVKWTVKSGYIWPSNKPFPRDTLLMVSTQHGVKFLHAICTEDFLLMKRKTE